MKRKVTDMNIIEIARQSGLLVLLDAKIGREEYHSISGSLNSLERFAAAVLAGSEQSADECVPALMTVPVKTR